MSIGVSLWFNHKQSHIEHRAGHFCWLICNGSLIKGHSEAPVDPEEVSTPVQPHMSVILSAQRSQGKQLAERREVDARTRLDEVNAREPETDDEEGRRVRQEKKRAVQWEILVCQEAAETGEDVDEMTKIQFSSKEQQTWAKLALRITMITGIWTQNSHGLFISLTNGTPITKVDKFNIFPITSMDKDSPGYFPNLEYNPEEQAAVQATFTAGFCQIRMEFLGDIKARVVWVHGHE